MYSDTTIPRAVGSMATYTCDTGFELTGTSVRRCFASGWDESEPTCQRGEDCLGSLYAISIIILLYPSVISSLYQTMEGSATVQLPPPYCRELWLHTAVMRDTECPVDLIEIVGTVERGVE